MSDEITSATHETDDQRRIRNLEAELDKLRRIVNNITITPGGTDLLFAKQTGLSPGTPFGDPGMYSLDSTNPVDGGWVDVYFDDTDVAWTFGAQTADSFTALVEGATGRAVVGVSSLGSEVGAAFLEIEDTGYARLYVHAETGQTAPMVDLFNAAGTQVLTVTPTGAIDMKEQSAPASPATDVLRLYVKDNGGTTELHAKDHAGTDYTIVPSTASLLFAKQTASTPFGDPGMYALDSTVPSDGAWVDVQMDTITGSHYNVWTWGTDSSGDNYAQLECGNVSSETATYNDMRLRSESAAGKIGTLDATTSADATDAGADVDLNAPGAPRVRLHAVTSEAWLAVTCNTSQTTALVTAAGSLVTFKVLADGSVLAAESYTSASISGTVTVDATAAEVHRLTLTGNVTSLTLTAFASGVACGLTLYLVQDGTGGRTVTWPGSVKWPAGVAPTLSTAANAVDLVVMETTDGGTTWYANLAGKAYA